MKDPQLTITLANARSVLRPTGAREPSRHDSLADPGSASEMLEALLGRAVPARSLPALRELQAAVAGIADALVAGSPPPLDRLNRIAAAAPAMRVLEPGSDGLLRAVMRVDELPVSAILAHRVIEELDGVDPRRMRRCGRKECGLVFYDTTRPGTRRWHSEHPCGLRERQRRHRDNRAATAAGPPARSAPPGAPMTACESV